MVTSVMKDCVLAEGDQQVCVCPQRRDGFCASFRRQRTLKPPARSQHGGCRNGTSGCQGYEGREGGAAKLRLSVGPEN